MNCPHCSKSVPDGSEFCPECGKKTENSSTEPDLKATPVSTPEAVAPLQPTSNSDPRPSIFDTPKPSVFDNSNTMDRFSNTNSPQPTNPVATAPTPEKVHDIPQGYQLDPKSGFYYISKYVVDPQTRAQVQQVTYFDTANGSYNTVNYPTAGGAQPQPTGYNPNQTGQPQYPQQGYNQAPTPPGYQQGYGQNMGQPPYNPNYHPTYNPNYPPKSSGGGGKVVAIVIIVVAVLFVLGVFAAVMAESAIEDQLNSYADSYTNPFGDDDDTTTDPFGGYSSQPSIRDESIDDSDIKPFLTDYESYQLNYPNISTFTGGAVKDGNYTYFLSNEYFFGSQFLFKLNNDTNELITLMDMGEDSFINSFLLTGNDIYYSVGKFDTYNEEYLLDYFVTDKNFTETKYLFREIESKMIACEGYLYLFDYTTDSLIKIGEQGDLGFVSKSVYIDLGEYSPDYTMSHFSIYKNNLYVGLTDESLATIVLKIDMDTLSQLIVFQSQNNTSCENWFIDGDRIFYTKYDMREGDNYDVQIAYSVLGDMNSEKIIDTYTFDEWPEIDVFLGRNDKNFFYAVNGKIVSASLSDPATVLFTAELSSEDIPIYLSNEYIILESGLLYTKDLSTVEYTPSDDDVLITYKDLESII